jgi:hypothetical protein
MRDTLRSPRQQQLRALLLELRRRKRLTQTKVAERLGKSQGALERGLSRTVCKTAYKDQPNPFGVV